jgi:hypothetical protein
LGISILLSPLADNIHLAAFTGNAPDGMFWRPLPSAIGLDGDCRDAEAKNRVVAV